MIPWCNRLWQSSWTHMHSRWVVYQAPNNIKFVSVLAYIEILSALKYLVNTGNLVLIVYILDWMAILLTALHLVYGPWLSTLLCEMWGLYIPHTGVRTMGISAVWTELPCMQWRNSKFKAWLDHTILVGVDQFDAHHSSFDAIPCFWILAGTFGVCGNMWLCEQIFLQSPHN